MWNEGYQPSMNCSQQTLLHLNYHETLWNIHCWVTAGLTHWTTFFYWLCQNYNWHLRYVFWSNLLLPVDDCKAHTVGQILAVSKIFVGFEQTDKHTDRQRNHSTLASTWGKYWKKHPHSQTSYSTQTIKIISLLYLIKAEVVIFSYFLYK